MLVLEIISNTLTLGEDSNHTQISATTSINIHHATHSTQTAFNQSWESPAHSKIQQSVLCPILD